MKQLSLKKYSLLGLVLIAASAVTTAMIPSKTSSVKEDNLAKDGVLVAEPNNLNGDQTCVNIAGTKNCHNTASVGEDSSTTRATPDTTSDDTGNGGDDTNTTGEDNA